MAVTVEGLQIFGTAVIQLQSFPVFCGYIMMVLLAGVWQRVTRPIPLRPVLIIYNLMCSVLSLYTFIGFMQGLMRADSIYNKHRSDTLTPFYWMYWITKNIELLDTVFMVLRHRQRQISFLHVYHHASMVLLSDYAYHHTPWPAICLILALNSIVHVTLYAYYGLTAWNPTNTPWWKQRLTEFQIIQFFIDFVYSAIGYLHHGFCVYGLFYGIMMTTLFCNFYYFAYLKRKPKSKKVE